MPTKNPRINVTFEKSIASVLSRFAAHEHKSVSRLVRELALEALEKREDFYLSRLAEKLDVEGEKTLGHDDAWK